MRFAIIGPVHPLRGGIAQYTTSLYQALVREHEVLLVSFSRQYPKILFPGKTQVDESSSSLTAPGEALVDSLSPATWFHTGKRIEEFSPDALVFQWWRPFFGPIYQGIIRRIRCPVKPAVIFFCHNILSHEEFFIPGQKRLKRLLVKLAFLKVDGFMVQAEEMVDYLRQLKPQAQVRRVYHPLYDFYSQWDHKQPIHRNSELPVMLFFGKIRKYKGLDTLLHALRIVRQKMDFKAIVAGEFYLSPRKYKSMAKQLGIEKNIEWIDHYIPNDQVPSLFRQSDLVVLPYRNATQSGVVPVAFQFDIPVIATRVGGLAEVIEDNQTGYLVSPGNANELAAKIVEYFSQKKKEEFQVRIRTFRKRLSWDQVADNLVELTQTLRGTVQQ